MANFIVSYDLNGSRPSHAEMDKHLEKIGAARGRILETVWYVGHPGTVSDVFNHVASILGREDRLIVAEATEAQWQNLLKTDQSLLTAWQAHRRPAYA